MHYPPTSELPFIAHFLSHAYLSDLVFYDYETTINTFLLYKHFVTESANKIDICVFLASKVAIASVFLTLKWLPNYVEVTDNTTRRHFKHKKCSKLNGIMPPQVQLNEKGKFSLCLAKYYAVKRYGRVDPCFLDLSNTWR
jgi:hypothetical protein